MPDEPLSSFFFLSPIFEDKAFVFSGNPYSEKQVWCHLILHLDACIECGNKSIYCIPWLQPESVLKIDLRFQLRSFHLAYSSWAWDSGVMQNAFCAFLTFLPTPQEKTVFIIHIGEWANI